MQVSVPQLAEKVDKAFDKINQLMMDNIKMSDNLEAIINQIKGLINNNTDMSDKLTKLINKNVQLPDKITELTQKYDKFDISITNQLNSLATNAELAKLIDKINTLPINTHSSGQMSQDLSDKLDQIINTTAKLSNGISTTPKEFEVKVTKGNEITGSKYEVEIELEGKKVGAFSQIGYYFYDGNIYIYDHFKLNESVSLPWQYHHLKVIKTEEDDYKLVFCNQSGHEYYAVPDNYRFVGVKSVKNIDLAKYYNKNGSHPSFIAKASNDSYSHSQQHGVDIYDISNTKAVGSLINEFGYYDTQNKLHYTNYQMGTQNHSYDPPSFTITKGDNQCQLHKMKIGSSDHHFLNDTMDCSLVEYIANNVNSII